MGAPVTEQGKPMLEQLAARWVIVISMLMIAIFTLITLLPLPAGLPAYSRFLPVDLSPRQLVSGSRSPLGKLPTATTPPGSTPMAKVKVESANCRARPLGGAGKITILYKNQEAEIVGRNEDPNNPWWYIKIPDSNGSCWLWGLTATTTGNVDDVPVIR